MVVDDQVTIISLLNRLLRAQGFEVTVLSDPVAAAMELSRNPDDFDLLITDLTMPRMTGLELARKARELRPGLPVVLMTGNASNLTDESLKLAGVDVVLDKPFRQEDLLGAMTNALSV
jgi:CheY-like chemotaxis protein